MLHTRSDTMRLLSVTCGNARIFSHWLRSIVCSFPLKAGFTTLQAPIPTRSSSENQPDWSTGATSITPPKAF